MMNSVIQKEIEKSQHWNFLSNKEKDRLKNAAEIAEEANEIAVYPNPTKNKVTIEITLEDQNANFKLYDLSGKLLLNQPLSDGVNAVQLKELKKGLYIYRIKDSDGIELKMDKLIIQ